MFPFVNKSQSQSVVNLSSKMTKHYKSDTQRNTEDLKKGICSYQ